MTLFRYRDIDQLKQDIREFTRENNQPTPPYAKQVQSKQNFQPMKQNFMRPTTSEGKVKSRNKEISSVQEKFIQIIAELERMSYLTEHSASLIKSLILEENPEVVRALNSYEADMYDYKELSFRLVQLAEKLSPYFVRPTSPLPKKDELIRLVNNLVRKRLRDDNQLLLLNKLILEGDELLYSTFEVFESDRDEEDLLDTLIRIVNRHKRSGKFGSNIYASPFYSSQKIPLVDNDQELIKERRSERPPSQGTISYFLESRSKPKSREHSIDRSIQSRKETREHSLERGYYSRKDLRDQSFDRSHHHSRKEFSPVSMTHELTFDLVNVCEEN